MTTIKKFKTSYYIEDAITTKQANKKENLLVHRFILSRYSWTKVIKSEENTYRHDQYLVAN
jgi:hypothetical protein